MAVYSTSQYAQSVDPSDPNYSLLLVDTPTIDIDHGAYLAKLTDPYVQVGKLTQYIGLYFTNIPTATGAPGRFGDKPLSSYYFKLDENMAPLFWWDANTNGGVWADFLYTLKYDPDGIIPIILRPVMTDDDKNTLALEMASSGYFKPSTQYISIGDEIVAEGVLDFKGTMTPDNYAQFTQYLTFMPRQFLRNFFMDQIYPNIPYSNHVMGESTEGQWITDPIYGNTYQYKSYMNLVWQGLVDLFNVANLAYINTNQVQPWDWEQQKLTAYYQSQDQTQLDNLRSQFDQFSDVSLALDPIAKPIIDDFATLPKLGDLGMEINRQNAVKELLKMKEYDTAQAIVDAYRYAKDTVLGPVLEQPIPSNIELDDGTVIAQKSSASP